MRVFLLLCVLLIAALQHSLPRHCYENILFALLLNHEKKKKFKNKLNILDS